MTSRSSDNRDGTDQDLALILFKLKQLFISHHPDTITASDLISLFELLVQSARTRICIFKPTISQSRAQPIQNHIACHSFRRVKTLQDFCNSLTTELKLDSKLWLAEHTLVLSTDRPNQTLYICLVRVIPHKPFNIGRHSEDEAHQEAYRRTERFLQLLAHEPSLNALVCQQLLKHAGHYKPLAEPTLSYQGSVKLFSRDHERLLKPLEHWADIIYRRYKTSYLTQAALRSTALSSPIPSYNNLFFFVRINALSGIAVEASTQGETDSFAVKLICPPQQMRDLSLFFHTYRESNCSWYIKKGDKCALKRVKRCVVASYWKTCSGSEINEAHITAHYQPLWEKLTKSSNGSPVLADAAFRTEHLVFERRALQSAETREWHVSSDAEADKLLNCVKCRLLDTSAQTSEEDSLPQLLFVPIAGANTPQVALATVINAPKPAHPLVLNEWPLAFYFVEWVRRELEPTFKLHFKELFLKLVEEEIFTAYSDCDMQLVLEDETQGKIFVELVNKRLTNLSNIHAFPILSLHLVQGDVILKDIHKCLSDLKDTLSYGSFGVAIEPADYWQQPIEHQLITPQDVFASIQAAIFKGIAQSYLTVGRKFDQLQQSITC